MFKAFHTLLATGTVPPSLHSAVSEVVSLVACFFVRPFVAATDLAPSTQLPGCLPLLYWFVLIAYETALYPPLAHLYQACYTTETKTQCT